LYEAAGNRHSRRRKLSHAGKEVLTHGVEEESEMREPFAWKEEIYHEHVKGGKGPRGTGAVGAPNYLLVPGEARVW